LVPITASTLATAHELSRPWRFARSFRNGGDGANEFGETIESNLE